MKLFKYSCYYLFPALLMMAGGCSKKFIDLYDPQGLSLTTTIKDVGSLTNAINGVYSHFQSSDYYNRTFTLVPDLMSDNVFISSRNSNRYIAEDNFAVTSGDGAALGPWYAMWRVIVNANLAIDAGEKLQFATPALQTSANQEIGEAYAVRALAYFDLIRYFAQPYNYTDDASHAGVPLVITKEPGVISPPRATVKEIYDQIIKDLLTSLPLMTAHTKNGYFTIGAAKALLAKVYLYMEDWPNAEKYATEVIDDEPYTLLTHANYVASWNTDFSTESLFEIVNVAGDNAGTDGLGYFYEQTNYGDALATADLYNSYSSSDIRRQLIEKGARFNAENPAYIVHKYPRGAAYLDDIKVLRLSEVYLIRAEARAGIPGEETLAQDDLNTIIKRADPSATSVTLTGEPLVERIIEERRKELAFEGNRLFDLNRKKMDVNLIQSSKSTWIPYPNDKFVMPVPTAEINANPSIGGPSAGYN